MSALPSSGSKDSARNSASAARLSSHLRALDMGSDTTIGDIVDSLRSQAFGTTMFVFAAPNLIPNPPGTSPILGLPLIFLTAQLVLGRDILWLPDRIRRRTVSGKFIASFTGRVAPVLVRLEGVLKPRYSILAGSDFAKRLIGIVAFPLALILLLPLPFLHMLPGAAMTCFAVALAERDGVAAAVGHVLTVVSVVVIAVLALAAKTGFGVLLTSFVGT